jgi:hypothetical protein
VAGPCRGCPDLAFELPTSEASKFSSHTSCSQGRLRFDRKPIKLFLSGVAKRGLGRPRPTKSRKVIHLMLSTVLTTRHGVAIVEPEPELLTLANPFALRSRSRGPPWGRHPLAAVLVHSSSATLWQTFLVGPNAKRCLPSLIAAGGQRRNRNWLR